MPAKLIKTIRLMVVVKNGFLTKVVLMVASLAGWSIGLYLVHVVH